MGQEHTQRLSCCGITGIRTAVCLLNLICLDDIKIQKRIAVRGAWGTRHPRVYETPRNSWYPALTSEKTNEAYL